MLGPRVRTSRARKTRATGPGYPPQGTAAGRARAPDTESSSPGSAVPPPGATFRHLRGAPHLAGRASQRSSRVPTPADRRPQRVGSGPQLPASRTSNRRRASAYSQTSLTKARDPPSDARSTQARTHEQRAPTSPETAHPEDGRLARGAPPRDTLLPPPRSAPLSGARKSSGPEPTPTHLDPQYMGNGPRLPAPRVGSRKRESS